MITLLKPKLEIINMNIALDFDETYTLDPSVWEKIVSILKEGSHDVRIVTLRYDLKTDNADIISAADRMGIPIIWCCGKPKAEVCAEEEFWVDIWIDDFPLLIDRAESVLREDVLEHQYGRKPGQKSYIDLI
jgi:hypothetical protein